MILNAIDKKLEFVLSGAVATNELSFTASYADKTTTDFTPAGTDGVSNGTTPVTLVAAPAASTQRMISGISIYNGDTVSATVTVNLDNNGTDRTVIKVTLGVGESLHFFTDTGWYCLSSGGLAKTIVGAGSNLIGRVDARDGDKIWSFKETIAHNLSDTSLTAGENNLQTPAVPAGEVHVITTASIYYSGTTPNNLRIQAIVDGVYVYLLFENSPTVQVFYPVLGQVYIAEGDKIQFQVFGATVGDDLLGRCAGYIMTI